MARIARIILPGKAHIVSHSGGEKSFNTAARRRALLEIVESCAGQYGIRMLAWCILSDTAYYVLAPPSAEKLSTFMRIVQTRYRWDEASSSAAGGKANRFACAALDGPATVEAIRFVESLALSRRGVKSPADYSFSSAATRKDPTAPAAGMLVSDSRFTSKIKDWSSFHDEAIEPARADYLAMRLRTGKPIGSKAFISRIEKKLGMNLSRPRGRPRKTS